MSAGVFSFVVLSVVFGTVAALRSWRQESKRNRLGKAAVAEIGALTVGERLVRVIGTVRAVDEKTVVGVYSGAPGVAAVFERWEGSGTGQRINRLDRQVRHTPFLVEDETGSIRLALDHVDFELELLPVTLAETGANRVFGAGIIAAHRNSIHETLECVVKPGDRVAVLGRVQLGPAGLCLTGRTDAPLVVTNHPALLTT